MRRAYIGLSLVAFTMVVYEILLTRIFSATLWYHFGFMVISIAMFGATFGAIYVSLQRQRFLGEALWRSAWQSAFWFALSSFISVLIFAQLPIVLDFSTLGLFWFSIIYVLFLVPFVQCGICISALLCGFDEGVGKLYAADLFGAALGCWAIVATLSVTDAIAATFLVSIGAAAASIIFARETGSKPKAITSILMTAALVCAFCWQHVQYLNQAPRLRFNFGKLLPAQASIYERWTPYSLLRVYPLRDPKPYGWGMSPVIDPKIQAKQRLLLIDNAAGTVLTNYDAGLPSVGYLRDDVTNLAHSIKHDASVYIIGVGGGRDVLSALYFNQRKVTGAEVNVGITDLLRKTFFGYTSKLTADPRVTLINDEARSYLARSPEKYDIIQASLVDTWASASSGAFTFTENSLYTVDCWKMMLGKLNKNGVLSFSRWYTKRGQPTEFYRLVALASKALQATGVQNPRAHLLAVALPEQGSQPDGVVTLITSKSPLTAEQLAAAKSYANEMKFDVLLSPDQAVDPILTGLTEPASFQRTVDSYPQLIEPPTDDRPFFFFVTRFSNLFSTLGTVPVNEQANSKAISILTTLLWTVLVLTAACLILPLAVRFRTTKLGDVAPLLLHFACIGMGFMLIEISLIQRLSIFLGHPIFGLAVVLFSLLLGTSLGSLLSERLVVDLKKQAAKILAAIPAALFLLGVLVVTACETLGQGPTPIRIGAAVLTVLPVGIALGFGFPLGMRMAIAQGRQDLTPWFWGINGAFSVVSSVLAILLSIALGNINTYLIAVVTYALSAIAVSVVTRRLDA